MDLTALDTLDLLHKESPIIFTFFLDRVTGLKFSLGLTNEIYHLCTAKDLSSIIYLIY
jgi:hypothetical protein